MRNFEHRHGFDHHGEPILTVKAVHPIAWVGYNVEVELSEFTIHLLFRIPSGAAFSDSMATVEFFLLNRNLPWLLCAKYPETKGSSEDQELTT